MKKTYYVYILTNSTNTTVYIGVTSDLVRRIDEHHQEVVEGFTKRYHLKKLVYYEMTEDVYAAISREKQLKNWKRQWKNELIEKENPTWKDLSKEL